MTFKLSHLEIPGLILIELSCIEDDRGFFQECFRANVFSEAGIPAVVQENHACSHLNVMRGLHYQINPKAQGKLIRCIRVRIYDVAVDIRRGSKTYGDYLGLELTAENRRMLYVPAGFAHGYCTLSEEAEVIYKTTEYWSPEHERTIRWNDPDIGIDWPVENPVLSLKDRAAPSLNQAENNFKIT